MTYDASSGEPNQALKTAFDLADDLKMTEWDGIELFQDLRLDSPSSFFLTA